MKFLLLGIGFCLPALVFGQFKLNNIDLTNPDTSLLYGGIENRLSVVGQNNYSELRVTSSKKSRVNIDKNNIVILPATDEGFDTLRVFKGNKLLLSRGYRVVKLEDPVAQLAFTSDTIISINRILANPFVTCKSPSSLYKIEFVTKTFDCLVIKKNGERKIFRNIGNKLSDEVITAIKNLSIFDELVFDNIRVGVAPAFFPRAVPAFKVKVR